MIDLTLGDPAALERAVDRARQRNIIIPTLKQQKTPGLVPASIRTRLEEIGLWDVNPLNLFRITWHNQPVSRGGRFGEVNLIEFPTQLTGVEARIVSLVGKWFPTGAHKVGAAFGCLVPPLVTGRFDPSREKAVWPSTGNYCRGGAYDSNLLGCESIAILPEGMSRERFDWLASVAGETIKTPGSESNVKEIFDKCWELRRSGQNLAIFNQFEEFGNYLWHYEVTGSAMMEVLGRIMGEVDQFRGTVLTTGSAGTLASGDYLKQHFPASKIVASEALQCPTLLQNGFGAHRIEGIGDKHVPWIHNVKNTDLVVAIDDAAAISLMRVFNEPAGQDYLADQGVSAETLSQLPLLGISSIANLLSCIKCARYYELGGNDILLTVATDSMEMYASRLQELNEERGPFTRVAAAAGFHRYLMGAGVSDMCELSHYDRKRIHNLKYFTWVEQQGKTYEEIQAQWYDPDYWTRIQGCARRVDALIDAFNQRTGLLREIEGAGPHRS
ncbi:MAG: pyridoxal-phosphate dependent enzyme [Acidobacteriota bacterium]